MSAIYFPPPAASGGGGGTFAPARLRGSQNATRDDPGDGFPATLLPDNVTTNEGYALNAAAGGPAGGGITVPTTGLYMVQASFEARCKDLAGVAPWNAVGQIMLGLAVFVADSHLLTRRRAADDASNILVNLVALVEVTDAATPLKIAATGWDQTAPSSPIPATVSILGGGDVASRQTPRLRIDRLA